MKKIIETVKNIWAIEDLRNRLLFTLSILAIYRLGSFVVIPGVDPSQLSALQDQTSDGLLGLLNMFTGGAFSQASIFALGIMPYISASIVVQLLGMAIPYFQKLQKEGESGRRKINNITRYLTILITGGQAPGYIANLHQLYEKANKGEDKELFVSACKFIGLFNEDNQQWEKYKKDKATISESEINSKIDLRNKARANKDYNEADRIRDELLNKGVLIEDKDGKTLWKFK